MTWNDDHQLLQATVTRHGVTQTTRYAYDALGRRVAKTDSFGSTHYLWDGDLMIHSQRGNKEALFIFEPNSFVPLATVQGIHKDKESQQTYWYQCDQIGAPQELTDQQGHIVWAADYKVWGEAKLRAIDWPSTGTDGGLARRPGLTARSSIAGGSTYDTTARQALPIIEQPFRFQGQQFDEETGLHYNRFRYYDPAVGRFVSEDPFGLLGGANKFLYSPNPNTWYDPTGLTPKKTCKCEQSSCTALQTYWPPNNGAMGQTKTETLGKGTKVDRYGYDGGTYVSPAGTSYPARALPPGSDQKPYTVFEVMKPIENVETSKIAPWFGEIGGGTQHKLPKSVQEICDSGHLKKVDGKK